MPGQCLATYQDLGYQCEDEAGHRGPHHFTTSVEWEGCWSCLAEEGEEHAIDCEAVLDALSVLEEAMS